MTTFLNFLLKWTSGLASALALFAIMVLTFFDVLGRKYFDHSVTGSLEMTEMLMVIVIFGALPLVSVRGEHVLFDSLDSLWPRWFHVIQLRFVNLICSTTLLALCWLMWKTGHSFSDSGETTAQLAVPKFPFVYGMGLLCGLTGLIHLFLVVNPNLEQEGEGSVV